MNRILAILLVLVLVGCKSSAPETINKGITVQSVQKDIRTHLPIGSSRSDVIAFLDERKYVHGWAQNPEITPDGRIVARNGHIERCLIPDVRTDGIVQTSIQIDFEFDDSDSTLVDYSVREVYKGP